jgi:dinuclear metal center YbgI/SA1388 family protein
MKVRDLVSAMEETAPLSLAEGWDKVGLLAGDRERALDGPVLLTIDLTEAVLAEAIGMGARAVVAYHPPIWEPLTRITDVTPRQRIILRALEAGLAIYSPHTALDAVAGGVTDWLAEGLSGSEEEGRIAGDCRALTPHSMMPLTQEMKIVTFAPASAVEQVRGALASAGAGLIGKYQICSFSTNGTGTFLGGEGANPAVGAAGQIEHVAEVRLEMVCAKAALPIALQTLRRLHPYEEPAIDVYELAPQPARNLGSGRRLVLDKPVTVVELAQRLRAWIRRDRVRYALVDDREADRPVKAVGICPGSGAGLSKLARAEGCDVFVTGEMNHHDVVGALHAGMHVILGNHTSTERGYLPRLAKRLRVLLPGVEVRVSEKDRDPLVTI